MTMTTDSNRRRLRRLAVVLAVVVVVLTGLVVVGSAPAAASGEEAAVDLRSPKDFSTIDDKAERSRAIFTEMGRVLTHPRCVNCHPAGDVPLQGEAQTLHEPPVTRGGGGHGVVGMRCSTCHLRNNFDPGAVPGAPHWHLAPRSMAWEGLSLGEICRQIQDPARNGGRDLGAIVDHMTEDDLVLWAWEPGAGRQPAPGSAESFADLVKAWARAGAECP